MASFAAYVQKKLYNELFELADTFLHERMDKFDLGGSLHKIGDSRLEDVRVWRTTQENLEGNRIRFFVFLDLEVETQEANYRYDNSQEDHPCLLVTCEGDIGEELENVEFIDVEDYSAKPRHRDSLDDELVPILSKDSLEKEAQYFLERYYPKALWEPMSVDPNEICKAMGLTIRHARISADGIIFGRIYFYEGAAEIYDDATGEVREEKIPANTILVDTTKSLLYGIGAFNNTVIHECVHFDKHRKAVAFARMFNKEVTGIGCRIVGDTAEKRFNYIEWQANNLAPRIQMPARMVRRYIDKRLPMIYNETGYSELLDVIEIVIKDVATHFAVSQAAAKIRLIDLGYEEARGALIYLDGHYIRPHKAANIQLEDHQTFSLSERDAAWLCVIPNTGVRDTLVDGRYMYVENHFVLRSPLYLERNTMGELQLTHYALTHMEECCLIFELSVDKAEVPKRYYRECYLNRAFDVKIDFTPCFHGGHAKKESQDKEINRFVNETRKFVLRLPTDYVESLKMAIEWVGNPSHTQIENRGVNRKTLERCLAGEKVKLNSLVAICICLHLPYKVSRHIIDHSPTPLVLTNEIHAWYDFVLETMYMSDLPKINDFLKDHGVDTDNFL